MMTKFSCYFFFKTINLRREGDFAYISKTPLSLSNFVVKNGTLQKNYFC